MKGESTRTILLVAQKELRSSLRDRQTVLYTLVLPLVMYPILFWVILQGYTFVASRDAVTDVRVAVTGVPPEVEWTRLRATLADLGDEEAEGEESSDEAASVSPTDVTRLPDEIDAEEARRVFLDPEKYPDPPDALLRFAPDEDPPSTLYYDGSRSRSTLAANRVRKRLATLSEELRREAVEEEGEDPELLAPYHLAERDLSRKRDVGGYILSFILPLTFVAMAVLGAFYPAVDTTAGEKERHTAETTLLAPTPRTAIFLGKVLAVFAAAAAATVLNLTGMALAAEHLLAGLSGGGGFSIEIPWSSFLAMAPLGAIFLLMVSASLVTVSSFAETFRQGQALLGVVQQVFILPAVVAILPGVKLTAALACVPVVQTVLAFKTLLQTGEPTGATNLPLFLVAAGTGLVYAGVTLGVGAHLARREALLTNGSSWRRLFTLLRSSGSPD